MKDDFSSPHILAFKKINKIISSFLFLKKYFEIDFDYDFIKNTKEYLGADIKIKKYLTDNNLPQYLITSFKIDSEFIKMKAMSLKYIKNIKNHDNDLSLSDIKARGEFLERVSAFLPLNFFLKGKKVNLNLKEFGAKKIFLKNVFQLNYKKIENKYIYFGIRRAFEDSKNYLWQTTTSGCAGHFSYKKALALALLELIQRDSLLMFWMNTISPKIIEVSNFLDSKNTSNHYFTKILKDLKKYNLDYYFLDITSDIQVPVVCCVIISKSTDDEKEFKISLGCAAGFSGEAELISAYEEALAIHSHVLSLKGGIDFEKDKYKPFSDYGIDKNKRGLIYQKLEMYKEFEFFINNKETVKLEDWMSVSKYIPDNNFDILKLKENTNYQLKYLKKIFTEKSKENKLYNVYAYNIKNKILSNFNYYVVRVICEGLCQLHLNENYVNPNHARLKEFMKSTKREGEGKLNIWPHPFS